MSPTVAAKRSEGSEYYNLGTYHRQVTSAHPQAQTWFDRGLVWCYGFNHEEAVKCFEEALQADSTCAMAYWGVAYALGPNYNKPWSIFDKDELERNLQKAHTAAETAHKLAARDDLATPVETALAQALQSRYPGKDVSADHQQWNIAYAKAMEKVYADFPDDLDVATLFADALMNLTPWSLWDLRTGEPTKDAHTLQIKGILDRVLALPHGMTHPGALHLYIHLMELSSKPETALPAAEALRLLVPDAGHLNHMSTHIDVLCGDYSQTMASNLDAITADERYLARAGASNFYSLYRSHDYHFRIYGAMFAGHYQVAMETVSRLEASLSEDVLRIESPPMADWLEGFLSLRVHVLVRFGRWSDLLDLKFPTDDKLYCVTTAMIHYGRGVALATMNRVAEAEHEQALLRDAMSRVVESRTLFNNTCRDILAVGAAMLDGELEYRRGNFDTAFATLRRATELSDNLPYDEPWGWMQPPRHALGALLLEQARVEEAAAVFKADLGLDDTLPRALQHPKNVWALQGYYDCLERLQHEEEARDIRRQLDRCIAAADVPIKKSCFCATADL